MMFHAFSLNITKFYCSRSVHFNIANFYCSILGGSALAPCPTTHRVQSCLLGVWCQLGIAPIYLSDLCRSVSGIMSGCSLRSTGRGSSQSCLLVLLSCKSTLLR